MRVNRRTILKGALAGTAGIAATFPHIYVKDFGQAWGAKPWIYSDEPIKVGLLWSQTGMLSVVENDSTQVSLFAIDKLNAEGGIAGKQIEPVVVDAKSDIKVYSEKITQLILRDRVVSVHGSYTSASRRAVMPIVMKWDHLYYYPTCYEGRECMQNIINTGPLANQHSFDLVPFMVENFGPKTYLVGSNYIWPKESNKNVKVWLERVGGEVLGEDYIRMAHAKGLHNRVVLYRHALRNAMIPTVTILGLLVGGLLSGAVLTETIFAWPGLGRFAVQSIFFLDRAAVTSVALIIGIAYSTANLIVDIAVAILDPRITYN